MTKEEFKNGIEVDDIIYNIKSLKIVIICSSYIRGVRNGSGFLGEGHYKLDENDIINWHLHDDLNSPLFVKFEILKRDFKELNNFVKNRLK